jgi:Leucine-rich repeat (LRR) protein
MILRIVSFKLAKMNFMNPIELIEKANSEKSKELNLSGLGLTSFPEEIFNLKNLETLKLMNNKIDRIPDRITELKKLKHLYLFNNKIRSISEKLLIEMPYLENFDLGDNPFDYHSAALFHSKNNKWYGYSECLKEITESKNSNKNYFFYLDTIKTFPEEIFELTNLEFLGFHGKEITEIPLGLSKLKNLKSLDLSSNKLSSLPADLSKLEKLEKIVLNTNCFETFPEIIMDLPAIKQIHISDNKIKFVDKSILYHPNLTAFVALANPLENMDSNLFNYDLDTLKKNVG